MIRVTSCASSANLGPGYDSVSVALDAFHEVLDIDFSHNKSTGSVNVLDANNMKIRGTPQQAVAEAMLREYDPESQILLRSHGNIPWGSGLGSSGACSVAAALAINEFLGLHLKEDSIINFAAIGEHSVTGTAHVDNVIASLVGGLVIIESSEPLKWHRAKIHPDLKLAIINIRLNIEEKTKKCRAVVPRQVPIGSAISNARNLAMLLLGLKAFDVELIKAGMNDAIVEPARSVIYPFYSDLKKKLTANGVLGVALSGAGPSVLCILEEDSILTNIKLAASEVLGSFGIAFDLIETGVCGGAEIAR
ncbi:MAG: homoserine kinase [Candidatus Thermoplasmatota archaeon]|nr:homoserine kinase [Candidatus Thermoplasmatota archaeon]